MNKRVALHTLGCRLNFSETAEMAQGFAARGYEIVPFGGPADVIFINTCTVTDDADSSCRRLIRKAHRSCPEAKIVVAGCYAQMEASRVAKMQGVDLVLGTAQKRRVFDYLEEEERDIIHIDKSTEFWAAATKVAGCSHTRSFLKIQDGCNYACSFCIIPQARGRSRAISLGEAQKQARAVVAAGFKEIVLTGVNIGEYRQAGGEKLPDLIRVILRVKGLRRLRLSSVEPNTINEELLDVLADHPAFMPHFHLPLQSADDVLLSAMRRKYTASSYWRVLEKITARFPAAGIGADIICGLPGESEASFEATRNFLQNSPISHFHVFPYSRRKGTLAAGMEDQIQHPVKKGRVRLLRALGEQKLAAFARNQVGKVHKVLFEFQNNQGHWEGHTPNFLRITLASDQNLKNTILPVRLMEADSQGKVRARLV